MLQNSLVSFEHLWLWPTDLKHWAQQGAMSGNSNVYIMFLTDRFPQNISKRRPFEEFLCGSRRRAWPPQGQRVWSSTSAACQTQIPPKRALCLKVSESSTQCSTKTASCIKVQPSLITFLPVPEYEDKNRSWLLQLRRFLLRRHRPINKWQIKTEGSRHAQASPAKEWPVKA